MESRNLGQIFLPNSVHNPTCLPISADLHMRCTRLFLAEPAVEGRSPFTTRSNPWRYCRLFPAYWAEVSADCTIRIGVAWASPNALFETTLHVEMILRQWNVKSVWNIWRKSKNQYCTCKTSTLIGCLFHVCGISFKMKCYIRKPLQKKHLIFFVSKFKIYTFQTYFTKSKTSRNDKWKQ